MRAVGSCGAHSGWAHNKRIVTGVHDVNKKAPA